MSVLPFQAQTRHVEVFAQFGGTPCSGEATQTQPCVPQKTCPIEMGCGGRFRCTSGILHYEVINNVIHSLQIQYITVIFPILVQVSVSAILWCVMETRTVRMVWMSETATQTAASIHVTVSKHLPTLTLLEKGM